MKSKEKRRLREQAAHGEATASLPFSKSEWRRRIFLLLVLLVSFGCVWAFCEMVVWSTLPTEIVGIWEIAGGPHNGDTFEFHRNGTMVGRIDPHGKDGKIDARVKMEGKKLFFTSKSQETGEVTTQVHAIRTLTSRQMVLEDEQGQVLKLERVDR